MTTPTPSMRDRFVEVTSALLAEDERVAVVLADISAGLFDAAAPDHPRVFNVGIREQLMIGVAAGLAMAGMRPVAHSYAAFLVDRAYEQLKLDLAHQDVSAVLVSVGGSYDAARAGRTHHSPGDVALLDTIGGWRVVAPGHPDEVEPYVRAAVSDGGRVYIRLAERSNSRPAPVEPGWHAVREGRAATVLAVGPLLDTVLEAASGLDVSVLHATTIRPFDSEALRAPGMKTDMVLVEPWLAGTSARFVSEALSDRPHRLLALGVGVEDLRRYGTWPEHERAHGLDVAGIRASLVAFVEGAVPSQGSTWTRSRPTAK